MVAVHNKQISTMHIPTVRRTSDLWSTGSSITLSTDVGDLSGLDVVVSSHVCVCIIVEKHADYKLVMSYII